MKYPTINKQPMRTVNIPELSGGVNLRDGVSAVNDDQLTDCENVWFADGLLKTRPGIATVSEMTALGYDKTVDFRQTDVFIGGYRLVYYNLSGSRNSEEDSSITESFAEVHFWLQSGDDITEIPKLTSATVGFVCDGNNCIYAFAVSNNTVYKLTFTYEYGKPEFAKSWTAVTETDYYVPIVMTHCKASHTLDDGYAGTIETNGTMIEGYNVIGDYYKMIYSTVNTSGTASSDGKYKAAYGIIENTYADKYKGMYIKAKYTDKNGNVHYHSVQLQGKPSGYWVQESTAGTDGFKLKVSGRQVRLIYASTGTTVYFDAEDFVEDNLEITAPYISDSKSKVFAMTRSVWFGGDAKGLSGGTRLFLCGNTQENERSLVMWSGLNNPLYFPENCYAYVGNSNQTAVAFGRQSDMLVIFKENETFFTRYTQNDSITADELINQSVVDYTASNVYFPMIQLHSNIGCDCPDTVQLCRNRLVWACSDGNVYTLISENQYNERAIFKISEMVKRRLSAEDFTNAYSADWNGHYMLFVKNRIYAMDYESYGYNYISSYTKTEDAQLRIPWWIWKTDDENTAVRSVIFTDNKPYPVYFPEEPSGLLSDFKIKKLSEALKDDDGSPITSMLKTKAFDFGAPAYTKDVPLVNIAFGNNLGEPVTVEFTSDKGNCGIEEVTLSDGADDEYSPEYVHNRQLRPCAHGVTRFVVTVKCNGAVSVDSISINYRTLGGARN